MKLPRPPRTVLVAVAVVIAITLPMAGLGSAYAYAGDVPRGTSVLGVELGGLDRDQAREALETGLAEQVEQLAAPVEVEVGGEPVEVVPEEVGLAVDVDATIAEAARRENPVASFLSLFGSRDLAPVVTVDSERLHDQLREQAETAGEAMTMPAIQFEGTEPVATYPAPGRGLDPELAADRVSEGWARQIDPSGTWREAEVIAVPLAELAPVTTAEEVDRLLTELARPAVAAPVTVTTDQGDEVEISPEQIAASLDLTADAHGEIVPKVDPEALREALGDQFDGLETPPADATFAVDGGTPEIVDDTPGEQIDTGALATELLAVLPEAGSRTVAAELAPAEAAVTTADLEALGIDEQVSTFTSHYDGGLASPRNQNIAILADMVDGAVVPPGEVFSLNEFTGPRGYEQGFQDAPVIIGGRLQPAVGGGLSQFTTTLFNASFYGGLEDVDHTPHSFYYSRYPAVIEATIFYPTLDMQFRNNTDHGILIDTSYNDDSITVTLWGTKVWDEVTAEWGERRDVTQPQRQYVDPGPSCLATQGLPGFAQDAWRIFHRDGEEVEREQFSWRYDAQPEVVCAEEPDEDEDED